MASLEFVKKIDNLIPLNFVLCSCTNKDGLVSNKRSDGSIIKGVPDNGLLGFIHSINPSVKFISTGGTYKIIKEADLPVIEVAKYTGYPEMKTGLVKSLHPAIHAGILAHKYTDSDDEFMKEHKLNYFDALIVNFYALDKMADNPDATFEMIRQSIDIGGPTMAHNARKSFISTAILTDPNDYEKLIDELIANKGAVSLKTRLELSKKASKMITDYMASVDKVIQKVTIDDLKKCYELK
jgi:phosphoribosylaminoimidazolecarboxamide formyltransferase / IMP cyclohydrolase